MMLGVVVLGLFLTVMAYRVTFAVVKYRWKLPAVLNAIGAIFMSAGVFMFWQFLTNDIGRTHNDSMPEVSMVVPAAYIVLSLLWYVVNIKVYSACVDGKTKNN